MASVLFVWFARPLLQGTVARDVLSIVRNTTLKTRLRLILHQQSLRLQTFQLPSSRIVGLVGDSGVGKSRLINSLLDHVDLARVVDVAHAQRASICTDLK